ncbi:MAG: hypothetical protein ABJA57_06405 [Ginsengibacter sp.]
MHKSLLEKNRVHKKLILYLVTCCIMMTGNCESETPGGVVPSVLQPEINYTLQVDTSDLSVIRVKMHIQNIPDTFRLAMAAHPEYDDKYWRFVENFKFENVAHPGKILREDSAVWRITTSGGNAFLGYKIHLPAIAGQRAAWRPFLSSTGGLVGGMQTFMYLDGATQVPAHVVLKIPPGWKISTGLTATKDPNQFFASNAFTLLDCPILIGHFKSWRFYVHEVPHTIAYWLAPGANAFDSFQLISSVEKIVRQAAKLFGRIPYNEYYFLLQDNSYGALEHLNSVAVGVPSAQLKKNFADLILEISHEYFHTWNLVRIRPKEWGDVSFRTPQLARSLWWSEGVTMFYADLILRRAGVEIEDPLRLKHLEKKISEYYGNSGNYLLSPEMISMAENAPPGYAGDYLGSPHVQGELLGTMMDIYIRSATNGKFSIDDVMRKMFDNYSGPMGFSGADVEGAMNEVCRCEVKPFFENSIRGKNPVDFNKFLQLIGVHMDTLWLDAIDHNGMKAPDLRVYAWQKSKDLMNLGIMDPLGCWGKAGLHTNDQLISIGGLRIKSFSDFRSSISHFKIGELVIVEVKQPAGIYKTNVVITGFKEVKVRLSNLPETSVKQQQFWEIWKNAE